MTDDCGMEDAALPATGGPAMRRGGNRVRWALVADRSPLLREGLRLYLETLGWRVVAGGTMDEGLAMLARGHLALFDRCTPGPLVPDLIVMGETGQERREACGPWPTAFDRLAAMRGAVRPVLLSIAAANRDLTVRARDRGFEAIHIDMPPLNLEDLLLGCVRRIERGEVRG